MTTPTHVTERWPDDVEEMWLLMGPEVDVDEATLERWRNVMDLFHQVQAEMEDARSDPKRRAQ